MIKTINNKKGFTLIEIILGLAMIGILAVAFLTVFSMGYYTVSRINTKNEMKYIGESTIESIKSYQLPDDSHVTSNEVIWEMIIDTTFDDAVKKDHDTYDVYYEKYTVNIEQLSDGETDNLWKIKVTVNDKNEGKLKTPYIELISYVPVPNHSLTN